MLALSKTDVWVITNEEEVMRGYGEEEEEQQQPNLRRGEGAPRSNTETKNTHLCYLCFVKQTFVWSEICASQKLTQFDNMSLCFAVFYPVHEPYSERRKKMWLFVMELFPACTTWRWVRHFRKKSVPINEFELLKEFVANSSHPFSHEHLMRWEKQLKSI